MCGRFVQAGAPKRLSERMDLPAGSLFDRPRFNVAPTTSIAAIRESRDGGRELVALKWGLIPSWSRDGKGFINRPVRDRRREADVPLRVQEAALPNSR
jgi:putative SOS response-associated peptidase YedK